jgi:tRNA 2-thiouridine synthesizing protein A
MSEIVDARGLSCPQPVLLVMSMIRGKTSGAIEVLVDNAVSLENVSRAAQSQGWHVQVEPRTGDDHHLILTR